MGLSVPARLNYGVFLTSTNEPTTPTGETGDSDYDALQEGLDTFNAGLL